MNFLAHLYLSFDNPDLIIGNFIGDSVKGSHYIEYPEGIQKGILLHRFIDHFTDNHLLVKEMISLLKPHHGRFSAIITDIFMDHFLCVQWKNYHHQELSIYIENVQAILFANREYLPLKSLQFLEYNAQTDRLFSYGSIHGIEISLFQLGKKITTQPPLEKAIQDLQLHYSQFESLFSNFFPLIVEECKQWISTNFQS